MKKYILITMFFVIFVCNVDVGNCNRPGRDTTLFMCSGKFELLHGYDRLGNDEYILMIVPETETGFHRTVLDRIYSYREDFFSGKIYFYSNDGYAVVDKNKRLCKVWYSIPEEERFLYMLEDYDNGFFILNSFNNFNNSEQKMFLKK